jgi:primosomal protein DnaI
MTDNEKTPEQETRLLGVSSLESTFEKIKPVKGMEQALKYAQQIATLKTTWKLLLIYGEWGNGKTLLLEAIALELRRQGIFCRVNNFPAFIGLLKSTFDQCKQTNEPSFNIIMHNYCNAKYLLMDDVGQADSYTDWSKNQLERIMLERYRQNLFTVMTTNKDLKELPDMVLSRFNDTEKARLVLNAAPDYRPNKGTK